MATAGGPTGAGAQQRLPPEVNRILYIRNLPFSIGREEVWHLFGKFGPVRQIRVGTAKHTRGSAYVVYEDIFDAKNACEHLSGFNVHNRYLIVVYHQPKKLQKKLDVQKQEEELRTFQAKYAASGQTGGNTPSRSEG